MSSGTSVEAVPLEASPSRDHALALHRFLGGVQAFGGVTLIAAYSLGAPSLPVDGAPAVLVGIGAVQVAIGVWWFLQAPVLRRTILQWPGTFVAATLGAALAVMALGGSNFDSLYVTSAMCWLIATGYALPGYRWAVASALVIVVVGVVWVSVEGSGGGYERDGRYASALLGLAAAVIPGVWLGRTTGATFATLNVWHLVERGELGLMDRLRARLEAVDRSAIRLAALIPTGAVSAELDTLRARLRHGVGVRAGRATSDVGETLRSIQAEHRSSDATTDLVIALDGEVGGAALSAPTADALDAVIRRQLGNVARHAPDATTITVSAEIDDGSVWIRIEDDGGGQLPFRAGVGTAWSARQLDRVGGRAGYFAGEAGVGFEVVLPLEPTSSLSAVPGLSVDTSLDRFAAGMLGALRWAGYVVDSLGAYVHRDELGALWLAMPIGAMLIEATIIGPGPLRRVPYDVRLLIASLIAVVVVAVFAVPADSPDALVPSTTSVVVLAHLIYAKRVAWFFGVELLRAVAVAPLVLRHGASAISLVVIYPVGFSILVLVLTRFLDRARDLERTAADALGRAALAGATLRGLSLHHDAVDVVIRAEADTDDVRDALTGLKRALTNLQQTGSGSLDPRTTMLSGIRSALGQPVDVGDADITPVDDGAPPAVAGAIDRITLIELAALAADERASCAPPGVLGRRRLRRLAMDWRVSPNGKQLELELAAEPTLRGPDARSVRRLEAVARTLGVAVDSTAERLLLTYVRR